MKKIGATLWMLIVAVSLVKAQTEHSLLWQISGNNLKKPSYLFGTIHLICPSDFSETPALKDAFAASEKVYLEVDMSDPSMSMKMMQLMVNKEKKLSDYFTAEEYKKLSHFFKDSLNMPLAMYNSMKPFILVSLLTVKTLACSTAASYEMHFVKQAAEQQKPVAGLELIEDQMKIFDDLPDSSLNKMIMSYVDDFDAQRQAYNKMLEAYLRGDLTYLVEQIKNAPDMKVAEKALLEDRNKKWIPIIEEAVQKQPTFIGVGAGHLAGEHGVIGLLRAQGYTVTPLQ